MNDLFTSKFSVKSIVLFATIFGAVLFGLTKTIKLDNHEESALAALVINVTTTPTTASFGQVLTYNIVLESTSAADTHTMVSLSGLIPNGTSLDLGSASVIPGSSSIGTVLNSPTPSFLIDTLSASIPGKNTITLSYSVIVNNNANSPLSNSISVSSTLNGVPQVPQPPFPISTGITPNITVAGTCICNNDNTVNLNNGTYTTRLSISSNNGQPFVPALAFTILSSTGLSVPNGTLFLFDNATGTYYLDVVVTNPTFIPMPSYTVSIDGPDNNPNPDINFSGSCSGYPTIEFPSDLLANPICVLPTQMFEIPITGLLSQNYPISSSNPPTLPSGFSYGLNGSQLVLKIDGAEIDPQESPVNLYYIQSGTPPNPQDIIDAAIQLALGNANAFTNLVNSFNCRVVSQRQVSFALKNIPVINATHFKCKKIDEKVYLSQILGDGNTSPEGFFTVTPSGGSPSQYKADSFLLAPLGGACYSIAYTIPDLECGDTTSLPVNVLITTRPIKPEFTINGSARPGPICASRDTTITLSPINLNENYFIPAGVPPVGQITGTSITLPAPILINPKEPVSVKYTICKAATSGPPPSCSNLPGPPPVACTDTVCKIITLYNDGFNCGDDALFESTCGDPFRPDVCEYKATPGLELGCRWFSISTPDILSAEISFDKLAIDCKDEEVNVTFNVNFFGIAADAGAGNTIGDFPGIGTICKVFNFKIFGVRPLGAIANLLGCNKRISEFIIDLLSALVGGEGSEVLVRADTDGDGAFDLTVDQGSLPLGGSFTIPNRVKGQGYITARAIGTWPSGIPDECGDLRAKEISLMDLLPIGSIPIVGPTIEDILTAAGCDVFLEFSAAADAEVIVTAASPAIFANCDTIPRTLYTYPGQSTTCVLPADLWSIPVAFTSCSNELLTYKGVRPLDSIREEGVYQTAGPVPGDTLNVGDTVVTYTAVSCNGNFESCSFSLRIIQADPSFEAGFMCCVEDKVFLGGAGWDGIGAPPIANTIRLDAIRGRYPVTTGGNWTGQGVEFFNPDGIPFNGDEYYLFNPFGLDGNYSLTYTIDGQPCSITFSRDINVTCQDLQVSLTDQVTCPAVWVPERIIIIDLSDDSITVTSSGLSNIGDAGGHYGGGPILVPVVELIDTIANDGRVVVPGFFAPAIRDTTFEVCIRVYQRNSPYGCEDLFCYDIRVVDTIAPVFLNCPTEPIVVDALLGQCEAFVNFPFPIASDSCQGFTRVTQVDTTGLKSGDLFPVGLTVLAYSTIDTVGNQNYCEIKIIVSDFRLPPRVQCPPNVAVRPNDLNVCGRIVNNIAPVSITDNCRDHVAVTYEVTGPNGEQVACGFENASGTLFPIGTSTVKYTVKDQPLILITEVQQRDGFYGVEITNFGPSAVDITCGKFMLKDAAGNIIETFTVPTDNNISTMFERPIYPPVIPILWNVRTPNNILDVGETFTHVFDGDQDGDGDVDVVNNYDRCNVRKYCFGFLDYTMDEAVVNDKLDASVILRNTVCDKDNQLDFRASNPCDTASFGVLNPGLPIMTFRNDTVGLQHIAPSFDMCTFTVSVEDTEAPTCIWHDSIRVAGSTGLSLLPNLCLSDTIEMPAGLVDDINIFNLNISTSNAGAIGVYLRGPSGKRIKLFDRICATDTLFCSTPPGIAGSANININLDETINKWQTAPLINTAPCGPTGQGGTYRPEKSFKEFYSTQGAGNWILEVYGEEGVTGTLNSWDLQILYQIPFGQKDTTIVNSPTLCDTVFSWIHPILEDNCIKGSMVVDYLFSNSVTNVTDSIRVVIANTANTINMMGCRETRRFNVGETVVRYTLTDQYGNLNQCSFKVTIKDTEDPVFVVGECRDRQIFLDPGACTGSILPLVANDNCAMDTVTYCFAKSDGTDSIRADINALPIGDYNIIAKAADIYGNVERCIFRVVVIEFISESIQLACINNVNLSLDGDCNAEVTAEMILADVSEVRCYDNYCIEVLDALGNPRSRIFTKADEGQSFKVVITDCKLPRVPPYNSCWGYIHIERKLGPEMKCPVDTTVFCNVDPNAKNAQGKYILGEPEVTSCEVKTTIWHQDEWTSFGDCEPIRAELKRTWYLENEKGERFSCPQTVRFRRMNLDSIVFPADKLDLVCTNVERNPSLLAPENSGLPSLHGVRVNRTGGLCMVSLLYTDERYEICHGTYEILRTWKVRDMCGPVTSMNPRTHVQVIKVTQKDGPVISDCPADITVTVDAWECLYNGGLPVPKNIDAACSPNYSFSASIFGGGRVFSTINANNLALTARAANLRKGTYRIVYDFKDQCLNKSQCSFNVTVVDSIAPVATAKEFITVSLTKNSANVNETGIAKLFVQQVDNGSYDNCGPVYMEVRRDDSAPACLNFGLETTKSANKIASGSSDRNVDILWNNNITYNDETNGLDQANPLHLKDSTWDTDKGQYVKFCCEDIGKEVKVWLRVWDDASGDGIFGNSGDNYNETWTKVNVEDKIVPKITCPAEIVTNCDRDTGVVPVFNFVSSLESGLWVTATTTNTPASFLPTTEVVCKGFTFEFKDLGSLNTCNVGKFTRTYRVVEFPSVTCSVIIDVRNEDSDPALEWPIVLHNWDKCTLTEEDVNLNTVRARINVERELGYEGCFGNMVDGNFIDNRDRCSADGFRDICRNGTGAASQWNEDPSLPYNIIPNGTSTCNSLSTTGSTRPGPLSTIGSTPSGLPRFNSNYKDPGCNVYGKKLTIEEYTIGDGCRKWLVKWSYINWCCNEQSACRSTIYKYEDTTAPVITACDGGDKDIVDASCTVSDTLRPTATDVGGCEAGLTWRVRLYPGNKTASGSDFVEIVNTDYSVSSGAQSTSRMVGTNPTLILNNIPAGEHGLRYFVTDGCGNVTECTSTIGVWPKAATPYCVSISSAVMKNGLVELWAKDFDKGSFTNCGLRVMLFTFNRGGVAEHPAPAQLDKEHYFTGFGNFLALKTDAGNSAGEAAARALYNEGKAQLWLPEVTVRPRPTLPNGNPQADERIVTGGTSGMHFGCKAGNDISTPIVTEMRVWDYRSFKAGTTQGSDFCSTRLSLIDNQGGCGPQSLISIGGNVATESAKALKNVDVELKSDLPEYPLKTKTDDQGVYLFNNQPKGVEYTLVPTRVDDVFDGINTLDLVHIQRHILGISKLSSPYKMIAADVDFDQAIRVSDIVTLRKLILGIEASLDNDKTWKFVNENDKMEQTPWPFSEQVSHALLAETSVANDFVAVKVGDVDGSGSANINSSKLNPRGVALTLDYENIDLKAGQQYEIKLNASNFVDVYGMQFTLSHKGLEVLDVTGRALDLDNDNFATHKNSEQLTLSWASQNSQTLESDNTLLTIKFISKIDGKLSSVIKLNNDITDTEAYVGNNFVTVPIELAERNASEMKFALSQNEPNPWKELTNINYVLPQSGVVKFKVLDVTGRLILDKQINGLKGNNNLSLSRSEIKGQSGILLYSIEFEGMSFQKKMIILE